MSSFFSIFEGESIVEASRSLSIKEQRVLALIVSRISTEDEDGKSYIFNVSDIVELISNENPLDGAEKRVEAMAFELMRKGLLIKQPKSELSIGWFSSIKHLYGQEKVAFSFNPYLKPYFLALKQHINRRAI